MGIFNFFSSSSLSSDEAAIFAKIRPVIADQLGLDPSEVTPNSTLDDLGCDELDLIELFLAFCYIGYSTPPKVEENCRTVRDIIRVIKKYY